jgi:type I restriction enzyme R subunit
VADSLLHFDGERYRMGDFVVMPTHVHLPAAFATADAMTEQCDSWLHYTAFRINRAIGEKGKFWQQEPFEHLVRSLEQFDYLRQYIADNPRKARLKPGEYCTAGTMDSRLSLEGRLSKVAFFAPRK